MICVFLCLTYFVSIKPQDSSVLSQKTGFPSSWWNNIPLYENGWIKKMMDLGCFHIGAVVNNQAF